MQAAGSWRSEETATREVTQIAAPTPTPPEPAPQPEQRLQTACLLVISAILTGATTTPLVAVGGVVIDSVPAEVKDFAVTLGGHHPAPDLRR